ncbi:Nramp family divalent metal transporter [Anatilimnocola floriformis]|uniref:Nramp family divalent metal transporter n=1 Tax=Anatilimnocola floriformis TaxID=2948575 RepID=UPI0020C2F243|nr:Nramp family divalent metal transporter [Anatilimnocola floriformis]
MSLETKSKTAATAVEPLAPWPGSHEMPRWNVDELTEAPVFQWRNILGMLGPGLVMGAAAIGGGEWLAGPEVTAKYGGALLWIATVSIIFQVIYNIEISRYTLYCGEPIFSGKFRIWPHPMFWVAFYLLLDFGSIAPYLAVNAAVPLEAIFLQKIPDIENEHWLLHKIVSTSLYLMILVPLIFGGKIYNALKVVMSLKLVVVISFLLFLGIFFSRPSTWVEIVSGLFKIGTVPVLCGEDKNGNGVLDPGEDVDNDGHLDVDEGLPPTIDTNGDGKPDAWEKDSKGKEIKWVDRDGDGKRDGYNTENVFVSLYKKGKLPQLNLALIATLGSLAAIAGNGGLTNAPISNFTRDQGWGMGSKVGAIPSLVGGHGISLSHEGSVFLVNEETLPRWRRWYNHIARDQLWVWMVACLVGVSLPSILSVEFLPRGTEASGWTGAAMTAGEIKEDGTKVGVFGRVMEPIPGTLADTPTLKPVLSGHGLAAFLWGATLFCGFLVMITSQTTTTDGFIRRWVDVFWTASPQLRKLPGTAVKYVYFIVLCVYACLGVLILWATEKPGFVFQLSTTFYNFAFAFSAWHTLVVNTTLLPQQLRPNWLVRIGLILAGVYFSGLGVIASMKLFGFIN